MRPLELGVLTTFLIATFLQIGSASAPDIDLAHTAYVDTIDYDGTAIFSLTIKNNQLIDDTIYLKPASLLWGDISFDNYILNIGAGRSVKMNVKISPPSNVRVGTYDVGIVATSQKDSAVKAQDALRILVKSEKPDVKAVIDILSKTAPKEITANIILENTGSSEITDLSGKLESDMFRPAEFSIGSLEAKETKLVASLKIRISPDTQANTYPVKLSIYQKQDRLNSFVKYVEILGSENILSDVKTFGNFLYKSTTISIQNTGNKPASGEWTAEFNGFEKYFVFSSPKPLVQGGVFTWTYNLEPGASITVTYRESYLPLIVILAVLVFLFFFLNWKFRAPFILKKEVVGKAEGNLKALKIKLSIKSRSITEQKNIVVEDYVPTPLKLVKEFGTMEPTLIKKDAGRVQMSWKFDILAAGEERIIAYYVKSTLGIVGWIVLPAAKLRCKIKDKMLHLHSNKISLRGRVEIIESEEKPEN